MRRVVLEDPEPVRASHHVEVVQVVAVRRHHRVIAARHHHDVVVLHRAGLVQAAVVGVDALEGEALRRVQPVVVGLFELRLGGRRLGVVLVRRIARRMAGGRDDLDHQQVRRGRVVVRQDVADIARVRTLTAHAAAHRCRVDHAHMARRGVARRAAQRHFGVHRGLHDDVHAGRHIDRGGRLLVEHALARAERSVGDAVHRDVDLARQHHQAEFTRAGVERLALTRRQAQRAKTDVRPTGALGRDLDDFAPGGPRLGEQAAGHAEAPAAAFRRSTMRLSVW